MVLVNGVLEAAANFFVPKAPQWLWQNSQFPPFWLTPNTTDSIAKFDEYGKLPQGPFLEELAIHAGRKDGTFAVDMWADNVGQTDFQNYYLRFYEPGKQYLSVGYDQIPHLMSTSAKSIFGGVGSSRLTVDPASALSAVPVCCCDTNPGPPQQHRRFHRWRQALAARDFRRRNQTLSYRPCVKNFAGYRNTMWETGIYCRFLTRTPYRHPATRHRLGVSTSAADPRPSTGSVECRHRSTIALRMQMPSANMSARPRGARDGTRS